jgi:hypothetical protein
MALLLKGEEFVATEALSVSVLAGLMNFARRRPLRLNGVELRAEDLAKLIEEAQQTGRPVWPKTRLTGTLVKLQDSTRLPR